MSELVAVMQHRLETKWLCETHAELQRRRTEDSRVLCFLVVYSCCALFFSERESERSDLSVFAGVIPRSDGMAPGV